MSVGYKSKKTNQEEKEDRGNETKIKQDFTILSQTIKGISL